MASYDETLAALAEKYDIPDDDLSALKEANPLRKKIGELEAENTDLRDAKKELTSLKRAPVVKEALKEAGVDEEQFASLPPATQKAIADFEFEGDKPSEEKLKAFITEWGLPTSEGQEPSAKQIVNQAVSSSSNRSAPGVLKPEDVNDWPVDKLYRFAQEHPDEMERLKRGETVANVAT
jgi:hypothetical protein